MRLGERHVQALVALTVAAAAVRFSTVSVQSFWLDEAVTVDLVRKSFGHMLSAIPGSESTPPLYYVLAWAWSRVFGTGEAGLRTLSALVGTGTVPVAYAAAARLVSRRAGLVVAALAAFNPLLVWYSQEARSYALLVFLTTVGLLLFARLLDERTPRMLALWAGVSAAALATHYFAAFVVVPEAAWLALRWRRGRGELVAMGTVAAAGAALLPLAIHQSNNRSADFIGQISLAKRVVQVPKQYLVGFDSPLEAAVTVIAAALAAYGLWLLYARATGPERRGTVPAAAIAAAAIGVPLVLAVAGADYLITRNVIAGLVPVAIVTAAGLGAARASRPGIAAAAALCAVSLFVVVAVAANPAYQRSDWRSVAHALGTANAPRALVISPLNGVRALELYAPGVRLLPATGSSVVEIDALAVADRRAGQTPAPPRPAAPAPAPPGFSLVELRRARTFTLVRYRAPRPVPVAVAQLAPLELTPGVADFAVQRAAR